MTLHSLALATVPAGRAAVDPLVRGLAEGLAALLPARAGQAWTVEPYRAWWTGDPAARLVQGGRALVVVADGSWDVAVAWQLPGREPIEADVRVGNGQAGRAGVERVARAVLRLVLPVLDDELAGRAPAAGPRVVGRLETLNEIGHAMRQRGMVTHNHAVGVFPNSSVLAWGTPGGARYTVTMHGTNPVCDFGVTGPVRAVERVLPHFLPEPSAGTPRHPLRGVRGRLSRRLAAHLGQFAPVEQLEEGGLAIGAAKGPYGYVSPALDPTARVRDSSPAGAELHGVGVDLLLSVADQLVR